MSPASLKSLYSTNLHMGLPFLKVVTRNGMRRVLEGVADVSYNTLNSQYAPEEPHILLL